MKHAATQELYGYWASLCRGRAAPDRNDIDPVVIRGILADTFMIDIDPSRSYPIRISGTRMNALFCRELKGTSLLDLWEPQERTEVAALIRAVLDDTRPMVAGAVGAPIGHDPIGFEIALLPLRHQGRTHARLLGCLSPRSIPTWLGLVPLVGLTLGTHRMIGPSSLPKTSNSEFGLREQIDGASPRPIRRGHFTVYDGGLCGERQKADEVIAM